MELKVLKFGGSSLADAEHFKMVKEIVHADPIDGQARMLEELPTEITLSGIVIVAKLLQ